MPRLSVLTTIGITLALLLGLLEAAFQLVARGAGIGRWRGFP